MTFNDLTPEQKQKVREAKSTEEILELAREEGYELTDADLEAVSGGWTACHDTPRTGRH